MSVSTKKFSDLTNDQLFQLAALATNKPELKPTHVDAGKLFSRIVQQSETFRVEATGPAFNRIVCADNGQRVHFHDDGVIVHAVDNVVQILHNIFQIVDLCQQWRVTYPAAEYDELHQVPQPDELTVAPIQYFYCSAHYKVYYKLSLKAGFCSFAYWGEQYPTKEMLQQAFLLSIPDAKDVVFLSVSKVTRTELQGLLPNTTFPDMPTQETGQMP